MGDAARRRAAAAIAAWRPKSCAASAAACATPAQLARRGPWRSGVEGLSAARGLTPLRGRGWLKERAAGISMGGDAAASIWNSSWAAPWGRLPSLATCLTSLIADVHSSRVKLMKTARTAACCADLALTRLRMAGTRCVRSEFYLRLCSGFSKPAKKWGTRPRSRSLLFPVVSLASAQNTEGSMNKSCKGKAVRAERGFHKGAEGGGGCVLCTRGATASDGKLFHNANSAGGGVAAKCSLNGGGLAHSKSGWRVSACKRVCGYPPVSRQLAHVQPVYYKERVRSHGRVPV